MSTEANIDKKVPKKRGRKKKEENFSLLKERIHHNLKTRRSVLLNLKITDDLLEQVKDFNNMTITSTSTKCMSPLLSSMDDRNLFSFSNQSSSFMLNNNTTNRCWSCTLKFDNIPIHLPIRLREKKVYRFQKVRQCTSISCIGSFCSYNCALSYAFEKRYNSNCIALLVNNYRENTGTLDVLRPSPPKETLDLYGGPYSVDEYRKLISLNTDVQVSKYPLVHMIEHTIEQKAVSTKKSTNQILDDQLIKDATDRERKNNKKTNNMTGNLILKELTSKN